jgi:hypothetical protein
MSGIHFFTDAHVHHQAIVQLRKRGLLITRCQDVGTKDSDDPDLLAYTIEHQMVMVTCDEDFLNLDSHWQEKGRAHGGIIYFQMPDQCKSIGLIVRELFFLHEAADYAQDPYNQVWRVKS